MASNLDLSAVHGEVLRDSIITGKCREGRSNVGIVGLGDVVTRGEAAFVKIDLAGNVAA